MYILFKSIDLIDNMIQLWIGIAQFIKQELYLIIMNMQQISGQDKEILEDSIDQFQEFKQQYITYSMSSQLSPGNKSILSPIRNGSPIKTEKPKLKIIHQEKQAKDDDIFLNNNARIRKSTSTNARIIAIGNAVFRSNFQSGNLYSVQKTAPNTYQIYPNRQINSERISAWFYFSCQGLKGQIKFIIKGFTKTSSLYNQGMKVCYRQINGDGWRRGGSKITYTDTFSDDQYAKTTYQLRFTFFFKNSYPNAVQFSYCFPYTYTNLINFLTISKPIVTFQSLGKSYQGRQIPLVTIGNRSSNQVIVLSARAHPGETVGSLMMQGFLKELISDSQYGKNLRNSFLFKIVPMINPDGVVQGNYRFSGSGFDLNRKWKKCSPKFHPEVYLLKEYIKSLNQEKQVIMYIDLHGHSRQKNVFFYGCCPKGNLDQNGNQNNKPKQFPFLMSKLHSPFRYDYCSYAMQKQKQGTARISMWNCLKINYVYTLQASFCGNDGGQNYQIADYQKIGSKLCHGMCLHFIKLIEQNHKLFQIQECFEPSKIAEDLTKTMTQFFQNPSLAQVQFQGNSSDSEPQAGQIPEEERQQKNKNFVSMQKYYKASKILKFTDKSSFNQEDSKQLKMIPIKVQKQQSKQTTANYSINISKIKDTQIFKSNSKHQKRRQIKTSNAKSQNSYSIRADILNKTIHEKLAQIHKVKTHAQQNDSVYPVTTQNLPEKYQSEDLTNSELNQKMISKKKAVSFEGAQYRRVRKLAEQHNRRHFSTQQPKVSNKDDDTLIKGLIGMNNLLELDSMKTKNRPPSFFPNTTQTTSKNRKTSIEMHFRRQIRANEYTARRLQINGIDHQVRCYGKQIL